MHSLVAIDTLHEEMPGRAWEIFKWVHVSLTVAALLINCGSLVVIYGLVSRLSPALRLLTSLAFAHMLAPWGVVITYFSHTSCQQEIHLTVTLTAQSAATLTLLALALIHIVATFTPLRFETIVSPRRLWITVVVIWILSAIVANLHFIVTFFTHDHETSFCSQVYDRMIITLVVTAIIYGCSLLGIIICYTRIFLFLRPISVLHPSQVDIPHKSTHHVVTGVILSTFHSAVWLPFIVSVFQHLGVHNEQEGYAAIMTMFISLTLILLNCACNPVIYGFRMDNVTTGYSRMYHKARYWISSGWSKIQNTVEREDQPCDPLNPIESIC